MCSEVRYTCWAAGSQIPLSPVTMANTIDLNVSVKPTKDRLDNSSGVSTHELPIRIPVKMHSTASFETKLSLKLALTIEWDSKLSKT